PTGHVLARESHLAGCRLELAGQHVEECRLPRPVRADDRATLALGDLQRDARERLDPAELASQLTRLDHARARAYEARTRPTMPRRAVSTKTMKTRPSSVSAKAMYEGITRSMNNTTTAPATGPISVLAPPIRTETKASTERATPTSFVETKRIE